jgi:hypothetical protein
MYRHTACNARSSRMMRLWYPRYQTVALEVLRMQLMVNLSSLFPFEYLVLHCIEHIATPYVSASALEWRQVLGQESYLLFRIIGMISPTWEPTPLETHPQVVNK